MKPSSIALWLFLALEAAGQLPFTYETDQVITSAGDFGNADGRRDVVVADRVTGQVTFGRPDVNGIFNWSVPEPIGMENLTGLAADKFLGGSVDFVAFTTPAANRVSIVTPSTANTQLEVRHIYPSSPSPLTLASFDPNADGQADLFIAGDRNNGVSNRYYYEFRTGLIGPSSEQWNTAFSVPTHRVFRYVRKTGTTPVLGEIYGSQFFTETPTTTGVTSAIGLLGVAVTPASLMTYGNFDGTLLSQLLIYTPGSSTARAAKITEPSPGVFNWAAATTVTFPKAVKQLVTIPSGAATARLGILFVDLTAAVFDFDGATLTLRSSLFGEPFTWLNPIGTDSLLTQNRNGWARYNAAVVSANNTPTQAGAFPALGVKQRVSNVVFFSAEPFVDPAATPLTQAAIRSWSTNTSGSGTTWNVSAADVSPLGIGTPSTTSYTPVVSASHALPNQYRANISTRNLEAAAGPNAPDLTIQPPGGTFRPGEKAKISFNPTLANSSVTYRINNGTWVGYNPRNRPEITLSETPPGMTADFVIEAYSSSSAGKSPTRRAVYRFAAATPLSIGSSIDADGDGMADAWEKSFNLTNPAGDADNDGIDNLAEFDSGTDPRDASDAPPPGDFVLRQEIQSNAGISTLRLAWDLALGSVTLESSLNLQSGSWQPVTEGIVIENQERVHYYTLEASGPQKRFFRLRQP